MSYFAGRDTFDSREVDERIDELEDMAVEGDDGGLNPNLDPDELEELAALVAFRDDVDSGEWPDGIGFIADEAFEDYAQDLAEDCGYVDRDNSMASYIDWAAWARDVQMDYCSADLCGYTYWYRA